MKVSLSERAYVKLALHAAKHPTCDALGALVGRVKGEDVEVTDALPMTHTPLSVTPTVEIALEQFAHHAALDGDQALVGAYLANARAGDVGFGTHASAVADARGGAQWKRARWTPEIGDRDALDGHAPKTTIRRVDWFSCAKATLPRRGKWSGIRPGRSSWRRRRQSRRRACSRKQTPEKNRRLRRPPGRSGARLAEPGGGRDARA